ncbi:MAG: leucine-rich repeat protein, partial [Clostridia bacterium]|nr:leucine-rich repeat protein [Clostridia bacterium]
MPMCPAGVISFPVSAASEYTDGHYTYTVSDGEASLVSVDSFISLYNNQTVPDSLGGYPVVAIASNAYENFEMESVVIPDGVRRIESSVFLNCINLSEITIPESVSIIAADAFKGCSDFTIVSSSGSYAESYALSMGFSFADRNSAEVRIKDFVESYGVPLYNKLNFFNGTATEENIDDIIFLSVYFSELNKESYTKVEIEEIVQKHFVVNSFDLSLSSCYDAENDSYAPRGGGFGGTEVYEPSITKNGSIYDVTIPYILAGEDEITGNLYLALTEDLKVVRFCVEHTFDKETDSVCQKCGYNKEIAPSYDSYGTTGECFWYLNGTELTISGNGPMGDYSYSTTAPWGTSITKVIIEGGVTTIGNYAFYNCSSLTSVTIPDRVTAIKDSAFHYCADLASVTIGDSVTSIEEDAFSGCDSLTSITIPDSVTTIGRCTFFSCENLASVTIGDSVTSIGNQAFDYCSSLADVWYKGISRNKISIGFYNSPLTNATWHYNFCIKNIVDYTHVYDNISDADCSECSYVRYGSSGITGDCFWYVIGTELTITGDGAMGDRDPNSALPWGTSITKVVIEDGVTTIGKSVFDFCSSLTSITISDSVTSIGDFAFYGCTGLTSITIPDSVISLGDSVFSNCAGLTSITIPDSVISLGDSVFSNCTSLVRVTIPDSVVSIGDSAFYGCSKLISIAIPAGVTTIGNFSFYDCHSLGRVTIPDSVISIGQSAFYRCYSLVSITLPESITTIGKFAFHLCSNLTSITIPASVTSIEESAFDRCEDLTSIIIPDGVTTIGKSAFSGCLGLTSVTIPDSVTTIGSFAFNYCKSLISVTIPDGVTAIDSHAFYNCSSLARITIPVSVTSIGDSAFEACTSLGSVTLPDFVASIGSNVFKDTAWYYDQPNGLLYVGKVAYEYKGTCPSSVIIQEGTLGISRGAF